MNSPTTPPIDLPELERPLGCPFCGATMIRYAGSTSWFHPGVVTDGACYLSGQGFYEKDLARWNTRHTEKLGQMVREAGPDVVEVVAQRLCRASGHAWRTGTYALGPGLEHVPADPLNNHWRNKARAVLTTLGELVDAPD